MALQGFKVPAALLVAAAVILVSACSRDQDPVSSGGGDSSPAAAATATTGTAGSSGTTGATGTGTSAATDAASPSETDAVSSSETESGGSSKIDDSAADFAVEFQKRQTFAPVAIGKEQPAPDGGSSIPLSLGENGDLGTMTAEVNPDGSLRDLIYKQPYPFYTEDELKQMEKDSDPGERGLEIFSTLDALIGILSPDAGQDEVVRAQQIVPDYLSHPRANLHKEETRDAVLGPIEYRATIDADGLLTLQVGTAAAAEGAK